MRIVSNMASARTGVRGTRSVVKGKAVVTAEEQEESPSKKDNWVIPVPKQLSWEEPFDLEGFPSVLIESLVDCAPCLLGREKAVYDADFFH